MEVNKINPQQPSFGARVIRNKELLVFIKDVKSHYGPGYLKNFAKRVKTLGSAKDSIELTNQTSIYQHFGPRVTKEKVSYVLYNGRYAGHFVHNDCIEFFNRILPEKVQWMSFENVKSTPKKENKIINTSCTSPKQSNFAKLAKKISELLNW